MKLAIGLVALLVGAGMEAQGMVEYGLILGSVADAKVAGPRTIMIDPVAVADAKVARDAISTVRTLGTGAVADAKVAGQASVAVLDAVADAKVAGDAVQEVGHNRGGLAVADAKIARDDGPGFPPPPPSAVVDGKVARVGGDEPPPPPPPPGAVADAKVARSAHEPKMPTTFSTRDGRRILNLNAPKTAN